MRAVKEQMKLYITKSLMDELRKAVPARERTRFVEDILARALRRRKLQAALSKSYGAMKTSADIDRWIADGRKGSTRDFSGKEGRRSGNKKQRLITCSFESDEAGKLTLRE